jgi:hypothetical protein
MGSGYNCCLDNSGLPESWSVRDIGDGGSALVSGSSADEDDKDGE